MEVPSVKDTVGIWNKDKDKLYFSFVFALLVWPYAKEISTLRNLIYAYIIITYNNRVKEHLDVRKGFWPLFFSNYIYSV